MEPKSKSEARRLTTMGVLPRIPTKKAKTVWHIDIDEGLSSKALKIAERNGLSRVALIEYALELVILKDEYESKVPGQGSR